MRVSNHAKQRIRERCGVNKKSVDRVAKNAFEKGLTHQEVTGKLCKWVDGVYLRHNTGNQIRLYQGKAFIFHNGSLITVKPIPQNLMHLVNDAFRKRSEKGDIKMSSGHCCNCKHPRLQVGDIVKHFKHEGMPDDNTQFMYKILHIAYDQDEKKQVVYQSLYGPDYRVWVRDYDEFMSEVDTAKHPDVQQEYKYELVHRAE